MKKTVLSILMMLSIIGVSQPTLLNLKGIERAPGIAYTVETNSLGVMYYKTKAAFLKNTVKSNTLTVNCLPVSLGADSLGNSNIYSSGGNVGIGTSSPSARLDVNGAINIRKNSGYYVGEKMIFATDTFNNNSLKIGVGSNGTDQVGDSYVAIGVNTYATGSGISIGNFANAGTSQADGFAIGNNASVANGLVRGCSLGRNARASHNNSWAIGYNAITTQDNEFNFGASGTAHKFIFNGVVNIPTTTNSSPTNGDIWNDGTNLYYRNGTTTNTLNATSSGSTTILTGTNNITVTGSAPNYTVGVSTALTNSLAANTTSITNLSSSKQTTLVAGSNISLSTNTISVSSSPTFTSATLTNVTAITGTATAPTPTINSNNTLIATTAYVDRYYTNFYNVKAYGAVGNGSTDDATAIQAAIDASILGTGNVNLIFPNGKYKVNTMLAVDNSTVNVNIIGLNSELVTGITAVGTAVLKISSANKIFIDGLSVNMNNSTVVHYGLIVGDYANSKNVGVCRIENCDFFNFGVINQRGILVENTPFVAGVVGNYNYPSAIISNCNFYNKNIAAPSITYTNNVLYGIGIQLGEQTDYARIINCNFNYISIGVWSGAGANMDVTACNFLACLPKQTTLYTYGCIYVPNTGTNNGKVNVVGCKFNHNYGYSIYWAYAGTERPLTVKSCHFIANATTAIYATHTATVQSRMQIHDNYFERCSQAFTVGYPAQPFGASLQPFIYLNNQLRASIKLNTFLNDGTYGVVTANSSDYIIIKNNNWFNITGMNSTVGANNIITDNDNL